MKKIIGLFVMFFFIPSTFAIGKVSNAKIVKIRVDNNGKAMVFFDQPIGETPATCVKDVYKNALAVDASLEGGKAVLSMALSAKATGSTVTVYGAGVCGVYGGQNVETWNHGFLK